MKGTSPLATQREHPHLISQGVRRNRRSHIAVSNGAAPKSPVLKDFVFEGPGLVDDAGELTSLATRTIVSRISRLAKTTKASFCIVWSPTSCTWFDQDGRHRDGFDPPVGDVADPWLGRHHDARVEWCWTIELPSDAEWSHLCVRRLDRDLVEIAPGEPMVLADFDEPAAPGLPDPAAGLLAADGSLKPPRTYRGQPVIGVRDEWKLLGPVQPAEAGTILRNPWPDDVRDACERIAGIPLPRRLTDAAWRAIDPEHPDVTYVGVLKAA